MLFSRKKCLVTDIATSMESAKMYEIVNATDTAAQQIRDVEQMLV